jgi:hypothetical protein
VVFWSELPESARAKSFATDAELSAFSKDLETPEQVKQEVEALASAQSIEHLGEYVKVSQRQAGGLGAGDLAKVEEAAVRVLQEDKNA